MWKFKPFTPKEPAGLEGRYIDVGNIKVQIKNIIAEGGFSSVYVARDAVNSSKQYALKHIICNDEESLELVKKEISVIKSLKGHPNIVTLYSHTITDMGRTKEAFLAMEFCEKSLVNVLESRGAGYFEEHQILKIFRDVCNAVFAMHCQSPPIAHRDLKAENLLLGSDGSWKLCDFGSTSINHKRFEKPEEMGIEEDNIRKHTTPAYRAPEMWDLYRRDLISEKVDIWALGCLLFRICYFKSAFDGESKLQVLNGNYRIPDLPKYSSFVTDLIHDMLQSSPDARPDITQVWFRVNQHLPAGSQKSLPDRPPEIRQTTDEGTTKHNIKGAVAHRTSTTIPEAIGDSASPLGAFWATQHAQGSLVGEEKTPPKIGHESTRSCTSNQDHNSSGKPHLPGKSHPSPEEKIQDRSRQRASSAESLSYHKDGQVNEFVSRLNQVNQNHSNERSKESRPSSSATFPDEAFNSFVADFDTAKLNSGISHKKLEKESLETEVVKLRELLKQANSEKDELASKYEKLTNICRSQRQQITELKQALGDGNQMPSMVVMKSPSSIGNVAPASARVNKVEGTAQQQGESKTWQAFSNDRNPQKVPERLAPQSVRTRNGHQQKDGPVAISGTREEGWGFGADTFTAAPTSSSSGERFPLSQQRRGHNSGENKPTSQPAGWAGF